LPAGILKMRFPQRRAALAGITELDAHAQFVLLTPTVEVG
jgi:hypothetical protein